MLQRCTLSGLSIVLLNPESLLTGTAKASKASTSLSRIEGEEICTKSCMALDEDATARFDEGGSNVRESGSSSILMVPCLTSSESSITCISSSSLTFPAGLLISNSNFVMSDGSSGGFGFSGSSYLLSLSVTAELLSVKQGKAHLHLFFVWNAFYSKNKKPHLGCGTRIVLLWNLMIRFWSITNIVSNILR